MHKEARKVHGLLQLRREMPGKKRSEGDDEQ